MSQDRISYSLPDLAAATGLAVSTLRREIDDGRLTAKFYNRKALVSVAEARRFIESLPSEKPEKH